MFRPTSKDINGCIEILRELNCFPRHSTKIPDCYTQITKLALDCQISVIMFQLVAHEQENGIAFTSYPKVRSYTLPSIALYKAFEAYAKGDILDETYQKLFGNDPELEKRFLDYMRIQVVSLTSTELFSHIQKFNNTFEMHIYEAASTLADYFETEELETPECFHGERTPFNSQTRIIKQLHKYQDFPIIRNILDGTWYEDETVRKLYELFAKFSSLRNIIRWEKRVPPRNFSVLGHSFDVAVYNYLLSLNESPEDYSKAEVGFFVGLYHDLSEIWTGDIPSPLKDAIPGLRTKTEELEMDMLKEHIFPLLPTWLLPYFKSLMFDLLPPTEHAYYKFGDNLAAAVEASAQIVAGATDEHFADALVRGTMYAPKDPTIRQIMKVLRKNAHISNFYLIYHTCLYKIHGFTTTKNRK